MTDFVDDNSRNVWIVVPAYNEAARIGQTLEGLLENWPRVVVVDDGSSDGTSEVAARYPVVLLRHLANRGQGASLRTGIEFALTVGAEVIVTFDADGQHSAHDVGRVIAPILSGEVDLTLGSRFLDGNEMSLPVCRQLLLRGAIWFTRLHTRLPLTDAHNGFRALSRSAANRLNLRHDRMAHASELLLEIRRQNLEYREVPVSIRYTPETLRKGQQVWDAFRIVFDLLSHTLLMPPRTSNPPMLFVKPGEM